MDGIFLQQLVNGLTLGSVYGLIAIGYTMVYGIIGMINFAHGEVYMISAYLAAISLALLAYFGSGFVQLTYTKVFILVAAFAGMALLTYIIKYTKLGRMCRATQQDRKMASILGINTDRVISYVFVIGAAMAALAGVLITLNYGTFDFYAGFIIGIKAFTAAVLGGIGSLPGAMLGGIILGISESLFSGLINSDYKDVFSFSLLVVILIFRPQGLLGRTLVAKV